MLCFFMRIIPENNKNNMFFIFLPPVPLFKISGESKDLIGVALI